MGSVYDFSAKAIDGSEKNLGDYRGKADVVLVFYCYDFGSI